MRRAFLLASILLFAGCFGKDDGEAPASLSTADPETNGSASNATLPDGRGESLGNKETNRTEEGVGGVEHRHDYWAGREQVVVLEDDVTFAPFPFFPEGQGTPPKGVAYLTLPEGLLVYEGAEKVVVLVKAGSVRGQQNPAPVGLTLQYRTAADAEWRAPAALPFDQPFEIQVAPEETDMPHSTKSLWNFRLVADRPSLFVESVNVTVTAHRGRDVADWPGHPDFYAERSERVVMDRDVKTHVYGFPENTFYEGMDAFEVPDKLISYGTGVVDVYVNVTRFTATAPVSPTEYILYAHNATDLGIVCCPEGYSDVNGRNDLASYHFQVPVDAAGMDGPYQPMSRWGFYLAARVGAPVPVAHGFTDGASYDIEYHMTLIARKAGTAAPLPP